MLNIQEYSIKLYQKTPEYGIMNVRQTLPIRGLSDA